MKHEDKFSYELALLSYYCHFKINFDLFFVRVCLYIVLYFCSCCFLVTVKLDFALMFTPVV